MLSRQVITHAADDPERFLNDVTERTRCSPSYSSALYALGLRHKVRAAAVPGIFASMVELSDGGDLLTKFLALPCPRMFIYGEQNASPLPPDARSRRRRADGDPAQRTLADVLQARRPVEPHRELRGPQGRPGVGP